MEDVVLPLVHVPVPIMGDGVAKPVLHGVGPLNVTELEVPEARQVGGDVGPDIGLQGGHGQPDEAP